MVTKGVPRNHPLTHITQLHPELAH
jgi:hypothetical protein